MCKDKMIAGDYLAYFATVLSVLILFDLWCWHFVTLQVDHVHYPVVYAMSSVLLMNIALTYYAWFKRMRGTRSDG